MRVLGFGVRGDVRLGLGLGLDLYIYHLCHMVWVVLPLKFR